MGALCSGTADVARLLDGLYFPHILDAILARLPAEALVSASLVCRPWRRKVKGLFFRVETRMLDPRSDSLFALRSSRLRPEESQLTVHAPSTRVLVGFSEICDIHGSLNCFQCNVGPSFEPSIFAGIKYVRSWSDFGDVQCVLHIRAPSRPVVTRAECRCCGWFLQWPRVSKLVLTMRDIDRDLNHWLDWYRRLPEDVDSFTLMYRLEDGPATEKRQRSGQSSAHWPAFGRIVRTAWERRKAVTVVNAASLDSLKDRLSTADLAPTEAQTQGKCAIDILRERAIAMVNGFVRAGPVCPVHFVTLEEYRAQVGELEYAIETQRGSIPCRLELSQGKV